METTSYILALMNNSQEFNFPDWLRDQIEKRGWSQSDLARRTNLSRSVISFYISGQRQPEAESLVAIADALDLPREHVLKIAGILENHDESVMSDHLAEMIKLFQTLSRQDQDELIQIARIKKNLNKGRLWAGDRENGNTGTDRSLP